MLSVTSSMLLPPNGSTSTRSEASSKAPLFGSRLTLWPAPLPPCLSPATSHAATTSFDTKSSLSTLPPPSKAPSSTLLALSSRLVAPLQALPSRVSWRCSSVGSD
ncbi:hypothetical protein BDQ12DRAFT_692859 [Crucibulum laeve]|uniref:Uncharacterized protein n=1 Tax=Crucibulum laeve TaxID=68775 RepID=A0A5C3LH96_9AGAR|nr:hypothetical protein BDQ12DRAFT_692859 [Crucibulum laeve]